LPRCSAALSQAWTTGRKCSRSPNIGDVVGALASAEQNGRAGDGRQGRPREGERRK
jgi:hypothetical protein